MSRWTHAICLQCWDEKNPDRIPHRVVGGLEIMDECCFCGKATAAGIYVRVDPVSLRCADNATHRRRDT